LSEPPLVLGRADRRAGQISPVGSSCRREDHAARHSVRREAGKAVNAWSCVLHGAGGPRGLGPFRCMCWRSIVQSPPQRRRRAWSYRNGYTMVAQDRSAVGNGDARASGDELCYPQRRGSGGWGTETAWQEGPRPGNIPECAHASVASG
jgi:hypothetical protein